MTTLAISEVIVPANIEDFYVDEQKTDKLRYVETCPECGMDSIYRVGRCATCSFCGWSACSL